MQYDTTTHTHCLSTGDVVLGQLDTELWRLHGKRVGKLHTTFNGTSKKTAPRVAQASFLYLGTEPFFFARFFDYEQAWKYQSW